LALLLLVDFLGCQPRITPAVAPGIDGAYNTSTFSGSKGGDEREVAGIKLCWCPPGRFRMGSPPDEPERRSDEAQVEVTLTKWGLHDMHGNVVEWCRDWYHGKLPGGKDPDLSSVRGTMNRDGSYSRIRRGSAWTDDGRASRSAFRQRFEPERRYDHIGFRVIAGEERTGL